MTYSQLPLSQTPWDQNLWFEMIVVWDKTRRQSEVQLYPIPQNDRVVGPLVVQTAWLSCWHSRLWIKVSRVQIPLKAEFFNSLTEVNNWLRFNEKPSSNKEDMEQTVNQRFKLLTFNCDLDFEPACWVIEYTLSHWAKHLTKILWKSF